MFPKSFLRQVSGQLMTGPEAKRGRGRGRYRRAMFLRARNGHFAGRASQRLLRCRN